GALGNLSTGAQNVAVGRAALNSSSTGSNNVAIGFQAMLNTATGSSNVAVGTQALINGRSDFNVAIGSVSLTNLLGGQFNTCLGYSTGTFMTGSESRNICIGTGANVNAGFSDTIAIGTNVTTTNNYQLRIGSGTGSATGQLNRAFISGISGIAAGATVTQIVSVDSTNQLGTGSLYWDYANTRLGVATITPAATVGIFGGFDLFSPNAGGRNVSALFRNNDGNFGSQASIYVGQASSATTSGQYTELWGGSAVSLGLTGGGLRIWNGANNANLFSYQYDGTNYSSTITAGGVSATILNFVGNKTTMSYLSDNDNPRFRFARTGGLVGTFGTVQFEFDNTGAGGQLNNTFVFNGSVSVTGSLSKGGGSFKIDHPLDPQNKYLYHSFAESPDMLNIYNGNVFLDEAGEATVNLPSYFEALNRDFKYQLTPFAIAIVYVRKKIENNQFSIGSNVPNIEVSWQVTGIRKDRFALANAVVPEVEKEPEKKGSYLHPEVYL
ncbi:MAG: hypothetical protein JSS32_07985, partial [Verrucomicrobia bacterium]|nr:hypothetical protein [Verrucomicrobiota bacterium]